MAKRIAPFTTVPESLTVLQALVSRAPTPELRKEFIVACYCFGAIDGSDAELLIQANLLEAA